MKKAKRVSTHRKPMGYNPETQKYYRVARGANLLKSIQGFAETKLYPQRDPVVKTLVAATKRWTVKGVYILDHEFDGQFYYGFFYHDDEGFGAFINEDADAIVSAFILVVLRYDLVAKRTKLFKPVLSAKETRQLKRNKYVNEGGLGLVE